MNIEEVAQGAIKQRGVVYYTVDGAFYVHFSEDMLLKKGVYRFEKGGFLEQYNERIIDMHQGFGDIYDVTFQAKYLGDIIIPQRILDRYSIYSLNFVNRIGQRCIN